MLFRPARDPEAQVERKMETVDFPTAAKRPLVKPSGAAEADAPLLHFDSSTIPMAHGEVVCDIVTQVRALRNHA